MYQLSQPEMITGKYYYVLETGRTGTDIDAALNKLNKLSASKPAIFMVLHHTSDPYKVVPDSGRFIQGMNMLTVDILFYEDVGLLNCIMNDEALGRVVRCFKPQERWSKFLIIATIAVIVLVYFMFSKDDRLDESSDMINLEHQVTLNTDYNG
ncbi:uncharacterized protein isoform X2 [Danio rerio]|uniref:Uncharacterized protein isoform X2 n=1 Tax=Danio rerio TaxID=7955 RepID=A0AC58JLB0_DANRE